MNQSVTKARDGVNAFFGQVYMKVALGLAISTVVSFVLSRFAPQIPIMIYSSTFAFIVLWLVEVGIVFMLSRRAYSGNPQSTMVWYVVYSAINGITLTASFAIVNNTTAIWQAFLTTALTFVAMSAYGHLTKRDLSSWRNLLMGFLIGLVVTMLINLFFHSGVMVFFTCIVSVILFAAYMAYDTQMIKQLYYNAQGADTGTLAGLATFSALQLYMDLISMFINLLQLFGFFDNDNN